jgi:hypothetical protein
MLNDYLRTRLHLDGTDGGSAGGDGSGATGASDGGSSAGDTTQQTGGTSTDKGGDKTTFTKAEVDAQVTAAVEARMAREAKARDKAISEAVTKQLDEERRKAAMTEAERLKAEKDEADKRAAERDQAATARERAAGVKLARADAKAAALDAGADPKLINDVLKLADIGETHLGEDGEPDAKTIKESIDAVLKDRPFLLKSAGGERTGEDFGGGSGEVDLSSLPMDEYIAARKKQGGLK